MTDNLIDKIKHLVEIEQDVFAVFTINSKDQKTNLTIAPNIENKKTLIENLFTNFKKLLEPSDNITIFPNNKSEILGKLKWKVTEYENIRILQIIEEDKIVVVLIKSNTSLDETVDNILGYYYEEEDDIPKSLF
jgi:hypothetical protein